MYYLRTVQYILSPPGFIVPLFAGKRGTIIQGGDGTVLYIPPYSVQYGRAHRCHLFFSTLPSSELSYLFPQVTEARLFRRGVGGIVELS